jgi:hypothetical protein
LDKSPTSISTISVTFTTMKPSALLNGGYTDCIIPKPVLT